MRFFILAAFLSSATLAASDAYPPPRFTDPDSVKKLESTLPDIDRLFQAYAAGAKGGEPPGEGRRRQRLQHRRPSRECLEHEKYRLVFGSPTSTVSSQECEAF